MRKSPKALVLGLLVFVSSGCGGGERSAPEPSARTPSAPVSSDPELSRVRVPEGFSVSFYSDRVPNARSLAMGPGGTLFVGTRSGGTVYALTDSDGDNFAETVRVVDDGLNSPNGVAFRDGSLYVAEISRILRYDGIESRLSSPPDPAVVNDSLPTDGHHGWKFIRFGPDGKLYVPVGAPCNVCERADRRYASVLRMNPDGSNVEIFARGVRNTVGFDWHPETGVLWFTDNGRDHMGDDVPPDELNRTPAAGLHFGFPYCHGTDVGDPRFGSSRSCGEFVPPALELPAHVAALGMRFYTGSMFPASWKNSIFVAEHGSWNRSSPVGYRVTRVSVSAGRAVSYETFADGWLGDDGAAWGRPVDVLVAPDGALLVSDDRRGAVYRISR